MFYILRDKTPVQVPLLVWAKWYPSANKILEQTQIKDVLVTTVFLGVDHGYSDRKKLLFETVIFYDGEALNYSKRYSTWEEAMNGHVEACTWVVNEF